MQNQDGPDENSGNSTADDPGRDSQDGSKSITSLSELCTETQLRLQQSERKIQLYTEALDPRVLNSQSVCDLFGQFVRNSRLARVEILVSSEAKFTGVDHQLLNLARKFTSFFQIRVIPEDYQDNLFAFYLFDQRHLIYRPQRERFEASCYQLPSSKVQQLSKYFDEVFEQASPASFLRQIYL